MLSGEVPSVIGRDSELDRLVAAISADRAIAVVGEAGVGKTSLVRAAGVASGRRLCEGGGFATLTHLPYLALQRAIDPGLSGEPADVAARVEERLGPDVLFIDDLQWLDGVTPLVIELLRGRIAFVLAIRAWDPGTEAASDLARRLGAEVITLGGVDRAAAEGIVRRARPDLSPTAVDLVVAKAGGNPLLLEELASRGEAPSTYSRLIASRVRQLSPSGSRTVELLAVADRPLPRDISGPGHDEAIDAGLAIDSGMMVELRHALIGEVIRDGLGTADRAAIHGTLADLLDDPSEVARHLAAAGRGEEAAEVALAAVVSSHDPRTTAALLVIAATSDPRSTGLGRRLEAARALDRISDRRAVLDVLSDEPGAATPDQLAEREALLGRAAYALGRHAEARAHLERAREVPVDPASPAAARVALERAEFAVNVDGAVLEALALLDDQIPRHGPDSPEYWALRSIREGIRLAAGQEPDLVVLQQAIEGAIGAGELATAADLARVVGFTMLMREGAAPGAAFLRTSADRLAGAGVTGPALEVAAEVVAALNLAGELVESVTAADEILERPAPLHARQVAAIHRARSLAMLGRHDAASEGLRTIEPFVTEDWFGRGEFLSAQADVALWAGRPDRAAELAAAVLSVPTPLAAAYLMPTITRAWAQVELGLPPDVEVAVEPTPSMAGAVPELDGLRLLHAGELSRAAERLEEAAERWRPFNLPRALACRWAAGDARRRSDSEAATADLLAVHGAVNEIGFEALAVRVRRSLRLAGVRLVRSDPAVRGAKLELTARERELLRLVEDGLSNIEIARRMGLGRPTVSRILSNAMSKLGVDSRAQAVAVATEPG